MAHNRPPKKPETAKAGLADKLEPLRTRPAKNPESVRAGIDKQPEHERAGLADKLDISKLNKIQKRKEENKAERDRVEAARLRHLKEADAREKERADAAKLEEEREQKKRAAEVANLRPLHIDASKEKDISVEDNATHRNTSTRTRPTTPPPTRRDIEEHLHKRQVKQSSRRVMKKASDIEKDTQNQDFLSPPNAPRGSQGKKSFFPNVSKTGSSSTTTVTDEKKKGFGRRGPGGSGGNGE